MGKAAKEKKIQDAHAHAKMQRIAPRKARLVIDLIRGKDVADAIAILKNTDKKASNILYSVLNSAIANAVNNEGKDANSLYVKAAYANEGPTLKRIRPRAQGRATAINKRTSHITVIVGEKEQ